MWVEYIRVKNLMIATMWKDVLEGDGLPTHILPIDNVLDWSETLAFKVMVPKGREHVADEIIRKL